MWNLSSSAILNSRCAGISRDLVPIPTMLFPLRLPPLCLQRLPMVLPLPSTHHHSCPAARNRRPLRNQPSPLRLRCPDRTPTSSALQIWILQVRTGPTRRLPRRRCPLRRLLVSRTMPLASPRLRTITTAITCRIITTLTIMPLQRSYRRNRTTPLMNPHQPTPLISFRRKRRLTRTCLPSRCHATGNSHRPWCFFCSPGPISSLVSPLVLRSSSGLLIIAFAPQVPSLFSSLTTPLSPVYNYMTRSTARRLPLSISSFYPWTHRYLYPLHPTIVLYTHSFSCCIFFAPPAASSFRMHSWSQVLGLLHGSVSLAFYSLHSGIFLIVLLSHSSCCGCLRSYTQSRCTYTIQTASSFNYSLSVVALHTYARASLLGTDALTLTKSVKNSNKHIIDLTSRAMCDFSTTFDF